MPLIIPDDDDHRAASDGPPFRVLVFIPEFVRRLINWLVRFLRRRRVR